MRIAIGSDHAGLRLKQALAEHLLELGHEIEDVGTHSDESTDYPDYAHQVARRVLDGDAERGVLVCGTGHGMAMAANKNPGIRAACVLDAFSARMVGLHNDANVLCLGQRTTGEGLAVDLLDAWLGARFEGGRHARRVGKMEPARGS